MPVLVAHHSVVVRRNGKKYRPPIGKAFEFTDAEARELLSLHPRCLRRPTNEALVTLEPEVTSAPEPEDFDVAEDPAPEPAAARVTGRRSRAAAPAAVVPDDDEL